ncbi:MAG: ABC transporter ATP-binding protein [Bacteroidetes bacterium]|nr:MAG: ABC transporter ATP-binding protein [Bacteroidota bacterium]
MLRITCTDIAKRYIKEVLFKDFNFTFEGKKKYVLLGSNSSGKSTLLKIIGGAISPTKGEVVYSPEEEPQNIFSFSSPEMDLLDDFTVQELFELHFQFKEPKIPIADQYSLSGLESFLTKRYGELSSGLKNKIKLSLALFTNTPVLLLDEPCTNFDDANAQWYNNMIQDYCQDQLIIVASNQTIEYQFCSEQINLHNYKPILK